MPRSRKNASPVSISKLMLQGVAGGLAVATLFTFFGQMPKNKDEKQAAATSVEKLFPASHTLPGNYLAGRYAASLGDFTKADMYLSRTMALDPKNTEIAGYAYRMRLVSGDMEEAADLAQKLYKSGDKGSNPEIMVLLAAVKKGDYRAARKVLESFDKAGFNLIAVPLMIGWMDYAEGKITKPLQINAELQRLPEFLPFIAYQMGVINDLSGFEEVAQAQYELALSSSRAMPYRVVELLGNLYQRQGAFNKADALYKRYYSASSDAATDMPTLHIEKNAKKPERIVQNVQQGMAEILYSTATILQGENLYEEALIYTQQVLYLNPQFISAQFTRAGLLEALDRNEEAIAAYDVLPEQSDYYLKGQLRKAYILSDEQKGAEAKRLLLTLSIKPGLAYLANLALGDLQMRDKQYAEAEKAYNAAITTIKTPEESQWAVYYARGISRERTGKWAIAEADFLKALELKPNQPDVMNYLGYSWLIKNQNVERAKAMIEQAVAERPNDGHIIDSMGWALFALKDYAGAVDYLEQAIEVMPTDTTVNDHLGDAYWRLGRKTEARFQWKRALLFGPDDIQKKELEAKMVNGLPDIAESAAASLPAKEQRAEVKEPHSEVR